MESDDDWSFSRVSAVVERLYKPIGSWVEDTMAGKEPGVDFEVPYSGTEITDMDAKVVKRVSRILDKACADLMSIQAGDHRDHTATSVGSTRLRERTLRDVRYAANDMRKVVEPSVNMVP